jgi:rhodanese-related sulfurtransferase
MSDSGPVRHPKSVKELIAEAEAEIVTWSLETAMSRHGDPQVVFIDVRDVRELAKYGMIAGALSYPRDRLEFWIDPRSPDHQAIFSAPRTFCFYCAAGLRSALAAQTARRMGLHPVSHLAGGFEAWKAADGAVEDWPHRQG